MPPLLPPYLVAPFCQPSPLSGDRGSGNLEFHDERERERERERGLKEKRFNAPRRLARGGRGEKRRAATRTERERLLSLSDKTMTAADKRRKKRERERKKRGARARAAFLDMILPAIKISVTIR